jgi:hypothetical protein
MSDSTNINVKNLFAVNEMFKVWNLGVVKIHVIILLVVILCNVVDKYWYSVRTYCLLQRRIEGS